MAIKKIGVLTSGGDAPGMNAAIRAVVRTALSYGWEVLGVRDGYSGLHSGNFVQLNSHSVSDLLNRGGTFLGTARFPQFKQPQVRQESVEVINDLKVSKIASPSRSTRKLRSACLETSESTAGESTEQQLPLQRNRRVRKREGSASDVVEDSKFDSSQRKPPAEFDTPATPRKRGRPRKTNPSEDVESKAVKGARSPETREGLNIQRRSTRNTPAKSGNTEVGKLALETSVFVPSEELATPVSSKKKPTKRTENQSQKRPLRSISEKCIDEEMTHKEVDDQEEKLLATVALTKSSRGTRTRSSKAVLLPDLSEPKNESLFSPPVSKIPRKEKGTFISIQSTIFISFRVFSLTFCHFKHD